MRKAEKIWLVAALCLLVLGSTIFVVAMENHGWDFTKLSTAEHKVNTYTVTEEINNISIDIDTADIIFVLSEDANCKVVCVEDAYTRHSVKAENGNLSIINIPGDKKWYQYIGIDFVETQITVYLPQGEYGALSIKTDTGDIEIPSGFKFQSIDISADTADIQNRAASLGATKIRTCTGDISIQNTSATELDLWTNTGEVNLCDITCKNIIFNSDTGDLLLKNVIASEKLSIKTDTGDVRFENSDATEIWLKSDTGDISGNLLSSKIFFVDTDTGDINIPKSTVGGKCEITTNTGDVEIYISEE